MRFCKTLVSVLLVGFTVLATGCGEDKSAQANLEQADVNQAKNVQLRVGISPGPYGVMLEKIIAPSLKEQGYTLQIVEFSDYVQPNLALESGDLDANLMQHTAYLNNLVATQGIKIEAVSTVPTLGMGVFSNKVKALPKTAGFKDEQDLSGGVVGLPNDAVNLARALRLCSKLQLIELKDVSDENKISVADITSNPFNLEFVPMESAQLARSLDSLALAFIPGNYAYAAKLDFSQALGVEQVAEDIKNVVAVRQGDNKLRDLFRNAIQSEEFKQRLNADHTFDKFTRPQWWNADESVNSEASDDNAESANSGESQESVNLEESGASSKLTNSGESHESANLDKSDATSKASDTVNLGEAAAA